MTAFDHNRKPTRKAMAFTLIEMLVVISVISVVMAISIPALKKAIGISRLTVCLSNMRQMSMSVLTYSAMNDGAMPPSARNDNWQLRYPNNTDPSLGGPPWYERLRNSDLLYYQKDDAGILHCPSDKRDKGYASYSANRNVMGFSGPRDDREKKTWPVRKMSNLRGHLGNLILLGERGAVEMADWAKVDGSWSMGGTSVNRFGGCANRSEVGFYLGRHGSATLSGSGDNGKIINAKVPFAMVDGHVESFSGNIDCYITENVYKDGSGFLLDRALVPDSPGSLWPKLSDRKFLYKSGSD